MLGIGGIGSAPKSEQSPSAQKPFRHFAARFRQARCFAREKILEQWVPLKQTLSDLSREFTRRWHSVYP
jgi:hypothetical protein